MSDDWDITHVRADLPPELWEFMKRNKFFGLNIPKEYGGLGFTALMNHKVIQKLSSISSTVSTTVGVPNSLGPAELLMHYGSEEQKQYYLPRLADGREVPCFALTGPFAGIRCDLDPRLRHRRHGRMERRAGAWHPPDARQALHHARAGRNADRGALPNVRPRRPARRYQGHRHFACAGAARDAGTGDRSSPFPAQQSVPERDRSMATGCSCRCRN
jgi:hypothetical protein